MSAVAEALDRAIASHPNTTNRGVSRWIGGSGRGIHFSSAWRVGVSAFRRGVTLAARKARGKRTMSSRSMASCGMNVGSEIGTNLTTPQRHRYFARSHGRL